MQLSKEQAQAATLDHPTILCIAGPGSGKTTTLVARLRGAIHNGAHPRGIVAITFTNAAAWTVQERLGIQLGYCGTLHGYMLRLLRQHGKHLGLSRNLGVLDADQTEGLIAQCIEEMRYKGTKQSVQDAIDRGPYAFTSKSKLSTAELVARHFCLALRRNGLVTFDWLLWCGWKLITEHRHVLGGVTHLFVDEYQDSGPLDDLIYRHMGGVRRFLVGDPDQSIYKFRGATVENVLNMADEPGVQVIRLEDNYRCGARICAAAQRLIEHNAYRVHKQTRSATGEAGEIQVGAVEDAHSELIAVAGQIKKYGPENCAVLLRTNWLVQEFTRYLIGVGIPVATKKRQDRPHDWRKAKLLLTLLNDPDNDLAAYWFLEAVHGAKKANEVKLRALASGMTANEFSLKIPKGIEVDDLDAILGKAGISNDSREAIARARQSLPEELSLADLILTLAQTEESSQEEGHGATVTTCHGAKGREWDTVLLPAFENEIFCGNKDRPEQTEEERRLAYVAFTRARHRLLISWCEHRKSAWGFKPEPATPSRFIKEAGL